MTKQEMRQRCQQTRKREKKEETERTLMDRVHERQKKILEDPDRKKWNSYHCWDYRHIAGILKDVEDGWIFKIEDGHVYGYKEGVV